MANSSILGGATTARRPPGHDVDALGPSDTSDSGSDVQGERPMATGADSPDELGGMPAAGSSDSDAQGTGERASADGDDGRDGADIGFDRIDDDASVGGSGLHGSNLDDDGGASTEDALGAAHRVSLEDLAQDTESGPGGVEGDPEEADGEADEGDVGEREGSDVERPSGVSASGGASGHVRRLPAGFEGRIAGR
jgi:hypothetical protein